jgi:hypothetical protein
MLSINLDLFKDSKNFIASCMFVLNESIQNDVDVRKVSKASFKSVLFDFPILCLVLEKFFGRNVGLDKTYKERLFNIY